MPQMETPYQVSCLPLSSHWRLLYVAVVQDIRQQMQGHVKAQTRQIHVFHPADCLSCVHSSHMCGCNLFLTALECPLSVSMNVLVFCRKALLALNAPA